LENLKNKDVPEKILSKISLLKDITFRKEKNFKDTLKTILGEKDEIKFEYSILSFSRSYKMKSNIILKMQDVNNELVDKAFKIAGIYYTGNGMFDELFVFIKNEELTDLLGYNQSDAHEIAILLNDENDIDKVVETLKAKYPDLQIESWGEIQPMIKMMQDWMGIYYYMFVGIILFALGFGIVNTMLMVVLERVKELGMLMAIGMNKKKVFSMIMLESVFLTITGGIVGIIFSAILTNITSKTGLDFSAQVGEGFEAMGFETIMYPSLEIIHYFGVGLLVVATGIIAAIYPARKALKLNPADAVRSDA
jgi:ABC-type lipoprotein release transport system permease subunit